MNASKEIEGLEGCGRTSGGVEGHQKGLVTASDGVMKALKILSASIRVARFCNFVRSSMGGVKEKKKGKKRMKKYQ